MDYICEVFKLIKGDAKAETKANCSRTASDGPDPFGLDLYVICAEVATEVGILISQLESKI